LTANGAVEPDCELCEAARYTHWYHEDDVCWVADCEVCSVPMVVWRPHGIDPSDEDIAHMLRVLGAAGDLRFGPGGWSIDRRMRQIPDHFHAHCRDPHWHAERARRPMTRYTGVGSERVER